MPYIPEDPKRVLLGAFIMSKEMEENGNVVYRETKVGDLHSIEMLGMVETARDTLKDAVMGRLRPRPE